MAPLPERADGPEASRAVARQSELLAADHARASRGARGLRHAAPAHASGRALRHRQQRPCSAGLARLRALHLADPPLSRHRRAPRGLCALAGLGEEPPTARELPEIALRCSQRERESADAERRADAICLAFLLRTGCAGSARTQTFEGVVTGLIGAGLFVRFGDVFEGFLPARRLDSRERYDVDEHGVALVGRASGRRIRLGDELSVRRDGGRSAARTGHARSSCPTTRRRVSAAARSKATTPRRPPKPPQAQAGEAQARQAQATLDSAGGRRRTHDREQPQGAARVPHPRAPRDRHRAHGHGGQVAARRQGRAARGLCAGARGRAVARRRDDRALRAGQSRQPRARHATASCSPTSTRSKSSHRGWPRRG